MPTIARRPAAQREREWLQARRLRAAELFATGIRQAEVARQLGVSRQSVHLGTSAGRSAIPKATKPARIAENFDVDFELTSEQLAALGHREARRTGAGAGAHHA